MQDFVVRLFYRYLLPHRFLQEVNSVGVHRVEPMQPGFIPEKILRSEWNKTPVRRFILKGCSYKLS